MLQHATMQAHGGEGRPKAAPVVADLTAARQRVWATLGVPSPPLTRRVSHDGVGAFIEARVACLVPTVDVVTVGIDAGFLDEQCGDHSGHLIESSARRLRRARARSARYSAVPTARRIKPRKRAIM
jgi:hypothetical protein